MTGSGKISIDRKKAAIAAIALVLSSMQQCGKREEGDTPTLPVVDVKTALVRRGRIEETITASGSTAYRREAQVRSPITGLITSFKLYNGDKIAKGDVLARVRTKESQAAVIGAEELLRAGRSASQREEAQKALDLALKTANTLDLRAPFDGILSAKLKNEGEAVLEGEQVATMIDPSSLIFLAQVPTASLNRIHRGQQVAMRFTSKPGRTFRGTVHQIEPQVNPGDQTVPVQVVFAEPALRFEGSLFGEAKATVGEHSNILLVPKASILRNDEDNSVSLMVVGSDSLAHKIQVEVGLTSDSSVEVSSPQLSAGGSVIIEGQYGLPDSTRVRLEN